MYLNRTILLLPAVLKLRRPCLSFSVLQVNGCVSVSSNILKYMYIKNGIDGPMLLHYTPLFPQQLVVPYKVFYLPYHCTMVNMLSQVCMFVAHKHLYSVELPQYVFHPHIHRLTI